MTYYESQTEMGRTLHHKPIQSQPKIIAMKSINRINISLEPGTRLVRESHGAREVMWLEETTYSRFSFDFIPVFWTIIIVILVYIFLPTAYTPLEKRNSEKKETRALMNPR
jgi:hypothetical protein